MPIEIFNASGTFTPLPGVTSVDVLIVAGGGGGGYHYGGGGGGGAGGVRQLLAVAVAGPVAVTVGAGGATAPNITGASSNGGNSSFGALVAIGGGGGGGWEGNAPFGKNGGSGGGSSGAVNPPVAGLGTAGQGNKGGKGFFSGLGNSQAGGSGGGAGAGPVDLLTGLPVPGGAGVDVSALFGAVGVGGWVGGGGAGAYTAGGGVGQPGGQGGGGKGWGNTSPAAAGVANTGGGGGGGEFDAASLGGNGGSGLVVVRYDLPATLSPPTDLVLVPHVNSIDASWTPPAFGLDPDGYFVSIDGGPQVDVGPLTSHTFSGLTPQTEYDISVKSYLATEVAPVYRNVADATASTWDYPDGLPFHVYDGNPVTDWSCRGHVGWVMLSLGGPEEVASYILIAPDTDGLAAPRDFQMAWSHDYVNWTYEPPRTNEFFANGQQREFFLAAPVTAPYWSLTFTENGLAAGTDYTALAQMTLMSDVSYTHEESDPLEGTTTTLNDGVDLPPFGGNLISDIFVGEIPVLRMYTNETIVYER